MTSLIFDLILIAVILISVFIGVKKGAMKVILSLLAFVVAAYLAYTLSTPFATFINNSFIQPAVIKSVDSAITNTTESIEDALPDFIADNADVLGININADSIINAEEFVQNTISPSVVKIVSSFSMFIIFIILAIVMNFVATLVNKIIKVSFLGGINKLLGGVFGAITGCVIIFVICFALKYAVYLSGDEAKLISKEVLDKSFLFRLFTGIF